MRTTAVYGSGKFGAAGRAMIADRPELGGPFQAEMLSAWLIRAFTLDLVEHLARVRSGARAMVLEPGLRPLFGVGNSTGLGMAPFLMNHPVLLNNWMMAREEALARVWALPAASAPAIAEFRRALDGARENARHWTSEHPLQQCRIGELRADLESLAARTAEGAAFAGGLPWDRLWRWAAGALSARMAHDLDRWRGEPTVAAFLIAQPEHRHIARRAQLPARHPFPEIRDNLIAADLLPIDLLRCKLFFFGASRFDPRSDRWVRICMYRDAPFPHELLGRPRQRTGR